MSIFAAPSAAPTVADISPAIDIVMTAAVVGILMALLAWRAAREARSVRGWLWLAFLEYMLCAVWEFFNGQDANGYRAHGFEIAKFLDASFGWAAPEVVKLLVHQPNAFETVVIGSGTNTGSMCAASAWFLFFVRGSAYAAQALVAGLAMFGALAIYDAFRDAYPDTPPFRLYVAAVLFPSVAFWTSALHKEAFCVMGTGLLLTAWRAAYKRRLRALFYGPLGFVIILMFRAPALPPLLLGLALHFVVERSLKAGKAQMVRPGYFAMGLVGMALGMILISRISPELALDRLSDTVANQQRAWANLASGLNGSPGGSAFDLEDTAPVHSTGEQLLRAPLALVNALFRPQLFDVTNPLVLVSALEMTAITWLMYRAFKRHGVGGVVSRIQQSPFLLMCTVITVVGCTFVGLTTFNFGTMARYRVPFLPFYGGLLAGLTAGAPAKAPKKAAPARGPHRRVLRRRTASTPAVT